MFSTSPEDATRWGSSVQLTNRGVNAAGKFWDLGILEKAFTPHERIQIANNKVGSTVKQNFHFDLTNFLRGDGCKNRVMQIYRISAKADNMAKL
jgi:hypothetical protein